MARACALHRATDAVVRARRAGRGPRFGGGFRLRAPAADELRVDLSERSGRREHRRAGAHDTSLAARRGATTVRAVLGRAAMQPFRVLEHSWTGQVGPAGEGGAQSALEPARVRCGAPGGAGQRRARRAARLARGAVDAAASPGQACAERRTSGFGRAARLGLAAAREERESRDRREPGARATNGQEYAEGCGKRCRTERPRGEGPRGIHFGGQGRRAPPPRPMLERRAVNTERRSSADSHRRRCRSGASSGGSACAPFRARGLRPPRCLGGSRGARGARPRSARAG